MNGLHQQLAAKRRDIAGLRATANDADASPEASHYAFECLPRQERELAGLCNSAFTGELVAEEISKAIAKLHASPVKSAELQLSIRDLETAGFRLRQHLGTAPEPSKPTVQAG
jgi:hypothetical protein